jgi:hypothetical protein
LNEDGGHKIMEYVVAGVVGLVSGLIGIFTGGKVSESRINNLEKWLERVEAKLDRVIEERG